MTEHVLPTGLTQRPPPRERLTTAIALVMARGVPEEHAYPPLFRRLARAGMIVPPMAYGKPISKMVICAFLFVVVASLMGGAALLAHSIGMVPRPVQTMIDAGPVAFFALTFGLSFLGSTLIAKRERIADLPKWEQL